MANLGGGLSGAASGAAAGSTFGPWGTAIGGLIGGIGGLFGGGGGADDEAKAAYQRSIDAMTRLGVPPAQAMQYMAAQQGGTNLANINPEYQKAQMGAMQELQKRAAQGGMGVEDQAAFEMAGNRANQNAQARKASILNQMQASGTANQGTALSLQESGDQSADNAMHEAGTNAAASARGRSLQAIMGSSQIGSDLFGQSARVAQAQDMINQYNTQSTNQARYYNAQQPRNQFEMEYQKAQGGVGPNNTQGGYNERYGQQQRDQTAGIFGSAGQLLRGWQGQQSNNSGTTGYSNPGNQYDDPTGRYGQGYYGDGTGG